MGEEQKHTYDGKKNKDSGDEVDADGKNVVHDRFPQCQDSFYYPLG